MNVSQDPFSSVRLNRRTEVAEIKPESPEQKNEDVFASVKLNQPKKILLKRRNVKIVLRIWWNL